MALAIPAPATGTAVGACRPAAVSPGWPSLLDGALRFCINGYTMSKRKPPATLTDALRQAITDSGLPFLTLEQETGVVRQSLMKFVRGESSLRLDVADKLAAYFDLELIRRKRN
jgi:hypothetical protein